MPHSFVVTLTSAEENTTPALTLNGLLTLKQSMCGRHVIMPKHDIVYCQCVKIVTPSFLRPFTALQFHAISAFI